MYGKFVSPLNADGFKYVIASFDKFYPTGRIELVGDSEDHMRDFIRALNREASKVTSLANERGTRYYLFNRVEERNEPTQDEIDGQKVIEFINRVESAAGERDD